MHFFISPSSAGSKGRAHNPTKGSSVTLNSVFSIAALHSPEFSRPTFTLLASVNLLCHKTTPDFLKDTFVCM
jgi:hypothetical protein